MYPPIVKYIIQPLIELKRGYPTLTLVHLRELEKTQWWSRERLETLQNNRLKALIKHAYTNVPYYHRMFRKLGLKPEDIKTKKDLLKLPILTKKDIRANLKNMIPLNYRGKLIPNSTGGTTGVPLTFYMDFRNATRVTATLYRSWRWAGLDIGDKYVDLWGHQLDFLPYQRVLKHLQSIYLENHLMLSAFNITEAIFNEYVSKIRRFKPKAIRGYPSVLSLLAKFMKHHGIADIRPTTVLSTTEKLFEHDRKLIEEQMGCEVFDGYSGRDNPVSACECSEHDGYHIAVENGIIEVLRDNEHVTEGELGEFIITNFLNYVTPFIRYQVGDAGTVVEYQCPCGRGLPMLGSIEGRIVDFIVTPNGKFLHGHFFTRLFRDTTGIDMYQVIQETKSRLVIKIVRGVNYSERELDGYLKIIKDYVGEEMKIDVKFVKTIPVSESGKRRFIISKVPIKFT